MAGSNVAGRVTVLSQEDYFPRYFDAFDAGLEPTPEILSDIRSFLLEKWRERAEEGFAEGVTIPVDLSASCKFSALFASVVFGADIVGNENHVFNIVDGEILDINAEADDVRRMGESAYEIDEEFMLSEDFDRSMRTCVQRVTEWLNEYATRLERSGPERSSAPTGL